MYIYIHIYIYNTLLPLHNTSFAETLAMSGTQRLYINCDIISTMSYQLKSCLIKMVNL